jgi:hypothetical protein
LFSLILNEFILAQRQPSPFYIQGGLFDHSQSNTLGLAFAPNIETYTIFRPEDNTDKYSNGVVLVAFNGYLYAQWQSSSQDEDAADTWVAYSRSDNFSDWSKPMVLAPKWNKGIYTSGGWWTSGNQLVAYINVWPDQQNPRGGYVEYMISSDGISWSEPKPLLTINGEPLNGIFEQDPHSLPDGRIINAVHEQPGMKVVPYYTDDPTGIKGWTRGLMKNLPYEGPISREMEPSWFYQNDGDIVMIFRDQASTFLKLASISTDRGTTWSTPVLTNMPDSRSKQCSGNFPDGTAFMVNNPNNNKNRFPLVITLSKDGKQFDKAYLLRKGGSGLQPLRYKGRFKRTGYHYPKAIIWKNYLLVSYATNKEDVEVTLVPLISLIYKKE